MSRTLGAFALALCIPAALSAQAKSEKPVWPDEGPPTWAPRPTATDITANDLRTRLYQFADDSMKGRRIGELGNTKGTDYIASEFKRLGLKPAGDNGTYFQILPFGPSGFDSATSKLLIGGRAIAKATDWIPVAPNNPSGIGGKASFTDVPTVFAGRWGETTPLDVALFRGKIAVFLAAPVRVAPVPRCDSVPNKFGAANAAMVEAAIRADSIAGRGARGGGAGGRGGALARDTRAQTAGAVGVLLIADSIQSAAASTAFGGRMTMEPTTPTTGPLGAATISRSAASTMFSGPVDQLTVGTTGQPMTATWDYEWHQTKYPARNVVAILPGSDPTRAAEYVLLGAHNDHVGTSPVALDHDSLRAVNMITRPQGANDPACRPTADQQHKIDSLIARARKIRPARRDSVFNGADDDGSGTVILLEVAEKFAKEKPARSIIFVSHEGEEAGLLGSKWFTDHSTIDLKSVAAALNMDMEAKGRTDQVKFGGPTSLQTLGSRRLSRDFGDIIDSVNATRSVVMAIDKTWDVSANPMNRFCRSDQVNYVHHDVPVTYFSTGYAEDYHQLTDEPRYADYEHMARIGGFIHDIMTAVANRKDRPAISGADPSYPVCR